jgi:hypothetical protein
MKVELVQFYIRKDAVDFYNPTYRKEDRTLGIYLGEDEDHVWIHPINMGYKLKDASQNNTEKKPIIFLSMFRGMINDIIIEEPDEDYYIADCGFGDMKYQGKSLLD